MSKTITISDETYENIKEQLGENERCDISNIEDLIGKKFYFRNVTYHMVGKVEKIVFGRTLELSGASWIADSGRFHDAIKGGVDKLDEVEPVGQWYINLDANSDFGPWNHELPKEQK